MSMLLLRITDDLSCFKSSRISHRFSASLFSRRMLLWPMLGGPQWPIQRVGTGPKRNICVATVRSGEQNTLRSRRDINFGRSMSNFWMGLFAAQTAAAVDAKPADRRHRVLSVLAGVVLSLLIGGGLIIAGALTR